MEAKQQYTTLKSSTTAEFKDRGSKFLAYAYPIIDTLEVKKHLQFLKKEHPKAVHFCYAYRLGLDGNEYRAVDDGEPSGSAGKPILGQIDSVGMSNILVIVVRYFGGSLLGVPGLINAYKTAAHTALTIGEKTEKWVRKNIDIQFNYPEQGEVLYLIKQYEVEILFQDMQLFCKMKLSVPLIFETPFLSKLTSINHLTLL